MTGLLVVVRPSPISPDVLPRSSAPMQPPIYADPAQLAVVADSGPFGWLLLFRHLYPKTKRARTSTTTNVTIMFVVRSVMVFCLFSMVWMNTKDEAAKAKAQIIVFIFIRSAPK